MKRPRRAPRVLFAGLVLLLASAAVAYAWREQLPLPAFDASPVARDGIEVTTLALDVPEAPQAGLPPPQRPPPPGLPAPATAVDPALADTPPVPPGTTVVEMLELLGERARAGDAVAACELGRALGECRMHSMMQWLPQRPAPPGDARKTDVDRFVDLEAARQEWKERLDQRCEGIDAAALSEATAFSVRAALGGHVPSLMDFINAPMSAAADFIRDPQLGHAYRTQVWPLLQRALASGNYQAASMMMAQLGTRSHMAPLAAVVPEQFHDPDAARALLLMMSDGAPAHPMLAHAPPPSDEARQTAERWADELFGGTLPKGSTRNATAPPVRDSGRCRESDAWLGDGA